MKREKQSGKSVAKFLGTTLLCALLGGVAGYCAAANGDALESVLDQGKMLVQQLGMWWFLPGFLLLFLGWMLYGKTKKLVAQAGEDDEVFQRCNRLLGRCMLCSGGATPLFFIAITISFYSAEKQNILWSMGLAIVYLTLLIVLEVKAVQRTKFIFPEKQGDPLSSRFQKDWYQSCDEAERQRMGQCSYRAFQATGKGFLLVMVGMCLLSVFQLVQPAWALVVGGLWLLQQMTYLWYANKT